MASLPADEARGSARRREKKSRRTLAGIGPCRRLRFAAVIRRHILKIRLSDEELARLDTAVRLHGGSRAGLTRRALADSLLVIGADEEIALQEALAPFASEMDWRDAARQLERLSPERWGDADSA